MTKAQHHIYIIILFLLGIISLFYFWFYGLSYYLTSTEERFFHPLHYLLKPSGFIGHGLGIVGSFMMIVGVVVYMLRKRVRRWVRVGSLKYWLELHIFLCSVGPIFVLYHTAFKFGGIVAVSFWSMVAVVLSGVIGRFIYVQIPRTIQGQEYSLDELRTLNNTYSERLKKEFDLPEEILLNIELFRNIESQKAYSFVSITTLIWKDYFANKKLLGEIKHELVRQNVPKHSAHEIIKICKSKLVLSRRIGLLRSVQKVFRYWHVIHLPFALIMLIIMLVHIGVTVAFGYRWIF